MKVTVDGIEYVQLFEPEVTDNKYLNALNTRFDFEGDNISIRDYFYMLLEKLWDEGEGFSGKRPFGNSCWEYDIYKPLIAHKFIEGSLYSDGDIDDFDGPEANEFVFEMIKHIFYK